MFTTILAYVIALMGIVSIGIGAYGLIYEIGRSSPISLRYYTMMIAMVCGGFGLAGIAQGLRVSVAIAEHLH